MKKLITLFIQGIKNPRYFIEALNLSRKELRLIRLLSVLVMTLSFAFNAYPMITSFVSEVQEAVNMIPEYQVHNDELTLSQSKPIYYQSPNVQLVVDPTIQQKGIDMNIPIPKEKSAKIRTDALVNIFIFKDQTLFDMGTGLMKTDAFHTGELSKEMLSHYLKDMQGTAVISVIIASFLVSGIMYSIQLLLIAFFAGSFNARLTQPVPFGARVRLVTVIAFIPLLAVEFGQMIWGFFPLRFFAWAAMTLYLLFSTYRNHTDFVRQMLDKLDDTLKK